MKKVVAGVIILFLILQIVWCIAPARPVKPVVVPKPVKPVSPKPKPVKGGSKGDGDSVHTTKPVVVPYVPKNTEKNVSKNESSISTFSVNSSNDEYDEENNSLQFVKAICHSMISILIGVMIGIVVIPILEEIRKRFKK